LFEISKEQVEQEFNQVVEKLWLTGDPNILIHFSDLPTTFGINPKSTWATPLGIYGYPIAYFSLNDIKTVNVPYAADRKYVWFFKFKNPNKVWILNKKPELSNQIKQQLLNLYRKELMDDYLVFSGVLDENEFDVWFLNRNFTDRDLFYATNRITGNKPARWTKFFIDAGIDGVIDEGEGIIHKNEPTQGFAVNSRVIQILGVFENPGNKNSYLSAILLWLDTGISSGISKKTIQFLIKSNKITEELKQKIIEKISKDYLSGFSRFQEMIEIDYLEDHKGGYKKLGWLREPFFTAAKQWLVNVKNIEKLIYNVPEEFVGDESLLSSKNFQYTVKRIIKEIEMMDLDRGVPGGFDPEYLPPHDKKVYQLLRPLLDKFQK
jgi:hypothetical protein